MSDFTKIVQQAGWDYLGYNVAETFEQEGRDGLRYDEQEELSYWVERVRMILSYVTHENLDELKQEAEEWQSN